MTGVGKDSQISALYIADSEDSSLDGEYVSGHVQAYCRRLEDYHGVKATPVSLIKFMEVKLTDGSGRALGHETELRMKDSGQILDIMAQLIP